MAKQVVCALLGGEGEGGPPRGQNEKKGGRGTCELGEKGQKTAAAVFFFDAEKYKFYQDLPRDGGRKSDDRREGARRIASGASG